MFKNKYQFNPETLSYDRVRLTTKQKLLQIGAFIGTLSSVIFLMAFLIFTYYFDTADYQSMQREKKNLELQLESFTAKMAAIDKQLVNIQQKDDHIYRVMFEQEPIPASVREAGFGGSDTYEKLRGFDNSELIIETAKRLDQLSSKLNIQQGSFNEIYSLAINKSEELECIPALSPISKKEHYISSFFGFRYHPILKRRKFHEGLDFAGPVGTKIYAPGNGVVKSITYSGGYGKVLKIDHGFGYVTVYAHLYKTKVKVGQKVKRGDEIASIGNSGLSTGPHLHYEVLKNGKNVDPLNFYFTDLSPEEFNKMQARADFQGK